MNAAAQVFANVLMSAAIYSLVAVGFAIPFRVTKFFDLGYAAVFALGAYSLYVANMWLHAPLWLSCTIAVLFSVLFGCVLEMSVYGPLRRRGASPLVLLLASLGLYFFMQNSISLGFGDAARSLRLGLWNDGYSILGARVTFIQIVAVCVSPAIIGAVVLLLRATHVGRTMRAVANDPELARACGVNSGKVILIAFAIGSALAGVAGALVGLDLDMTPTMGMSALMMGVVVLIVGGTESIPGAILGAFLVSLAQHLGAWQIGSQWKDAIAFVILLAFLMFRPQGFFGRMVKKAAV